MASTLTTTGSGGSETTSVGGTGGGNAMHWVGAWASGPQLTEPNNLPPNPGLSGNTLRQIVFPTLSGTELRVRISNEFGNGPVTLNAVHLATSTGGSAIDTATDQALSFDGMAGVTIDAGEARYSDPLGYPLTALSELSITIAFGDVPSDITGHPGSRTTSYLQPGQMPSAANLDGGASTEHWYYISGIDVMAPEQAGAIVTLGDSITDGRGSTTDGNNRWPDNLARRLQADPATQHISVLNQGIGGNAVLSGGLGPTALERFERDVLSQSGVRWVIVLEGVNDIGSSLTAEVADDLIGAYQQFIQAAHERGLLIYGVPILPFGGSSYDSVAHEEARQAVNDWMRTSGEFDAVIDLDAAVRDPNNSNGLLSAYDSGDQLHLSVAGYQAMADSIELSLFSD